MQSTSISFCFFSKWKIVYNNLYAIFGEKKCFYCLHDLFFLLSIKVENNHICSIHVFSVVLYSFICPFSALAWTTEQPNNHMTVCEETYSPKSYRYHPGLWSGKKWSCCKTVNRTAFGCQAATLWTETNNNPSPSKLSFADFFLLLTNKIHSFAQSRRRIRISVI